MGYKKYSNNPKDVRKGVRDKKKNWHKEKW